MNANYGYSYNDEIREKGEKMRKNVISLALTGAVIITGIFASQNEIQAKTKKVKLSAKKITMKLGEKKTLKIINVKKRAKKKIKWSLNTKKYIKLKKSGKYAVKLTAKKAGKTKVTAKVAKKKYTCTVTVNPEPERKWPGCGTSHVRPYRSNEELYQAAVKDAMIADKDEIHPLVTITRNSDRVTWNKTGDKVLMLSWHKDPERYPEGEDVVLDDEPVWTFTDREIVSRYQERKGYYTDWNMRLRQLTGSKPDADQSHVTAFWVSTKDLIRPAYETDITKQMKLGFSGEDKAGELYTSWYKKWFDQNIIASYFDDFHPWTRLGYTYDWADNDKEYGLSEFLIMQGSSVQIEFTKTTDEFIQWLGLQTV